MTQMMIFKGLQIALSRYTGSTLEAYRSCGRTFAPKISIQSSCLWPT
jgi:hypothetical protein